MRNWNWNKSSNAACLLTLIFFSFSTHATHADLNLAQIATHNSLLSTAQQEGTVEVIIKLNVPTVPAGTLSATAAHSQQMAIQAAGDDVLATLQAHQSANVTRYEHLPYAAASLTPAALQAALNDPAVAEIYPDEKMSPLLTSSRAVVRAPVTSVSARPAGGKDQVIVILDTGVDYNHPFFEGRVIDGACFSNAPGSGTTLCPNGTKTDYGLDAGKNCDVNRVASCFHGTHVAGIAAGHNDSMSGVAPEAKIFAIQVFTEYTATQCNSTGPCLYTSTSDLLRAYDYIYSRRNDFNFASVNMSLGGSPNGGVCDYGSMPAAVNLLKSAGIVSVAASGNSAYASGISSPACISSVVSVGASNDNDTIPNFSNSASFLDVLAPGNDIYSAYPGNSANPDRYAAAAGTSMAAPHVAGGFALLKAAHPTKTVDQLIALMKSEGVSITDTRNNYTFPRMDLVSLGTVPEPVTPTPPPPAPAVVFTDNDFTGDGKADILWRNVATTQTHLYQMDGFDIQASLAVSGISLDADWIVAGVGDFDGDGTSDLIARNMSTGHNRVFLIEAGQVKQDEYIKTVTDLNWEIVKVGDLDGDDKADILWRHATTGVNWIYRMDGVSVVGSEYLSYVRDPRWKVAALADVNGDGKRDVIWHHATSGIVWIYLLNGSKIITSQPFGRVADLNWQIRASGDLDGDGKDDLIWRHAQRGLNWAHLMNGVKVKKGGPVPAVPDLNWQIAQVSDFDGDLKYDILWRNNVTGRNWQFQMNGHVVTNSGAVNTVPDSNWQVRSAR